FFFQAEDGIRDRNVTGVQTRALPIFASCRSSVAVTSRCNCPSFRDAQGLQPTRAKPRISPAFSTRHPLSGPYKENVPISRPLTRSEERRVGKEGRCRRSNEKCENKRE